MTANLKAWWAERSPREQKLLALMIALLAATIVWFGIVRPLGVARDAAEERHARAVVALGKLRELGGRFDAARGRGVVPIGEPLVAFLGRDAGDAGLPVERLEAQGSERAVLTIAAVRPPALFGWVQRVEVRHGLIVERLTATRNPDTTIAVQITFRQPAR